MSTIVRVRQTTVGPFRGIMTELQHFKWSYIKNPWQHNIEQDSSYEEEGNYEMGRRSQRLRLRVIRKRKTRSPRQGWGEEEKKHEEKLEYVVE